MRGVHASPDHIATAVVIVRIVVAVRVIAISIRIIVSVVVIRVEAEAAPEVAIAIMKSTAAETTIAIVKSTTIMESATISESAGHAATTVSLRLAKRWRSVPPLSRASAPRMVTVAVIPETSGVPGGTSVILMRTGTRCGKRTHV